MSPAALSMRLARSPLLLQLDLRPALPTLRNAHGDHFAGTIHDLRTVRPMNMLTVPHRLAREVLAATPPRQGRLADPAVPLRPAIRPRLQVLKKTQVQPSARMTSHV
jgi:hypothetical protein